jgi:hypothetical protein
VVGGPLPDPPPRVDGSRASAAALVGYLRKQRFTDVSCRRTPGAERVRCVATDAHGTRKSLSFPFSSSTCTMSTAGSTSELHCSSKVEVRPLG